MTASLTDAHLLDSQMCTDDIRNARPTKAKELVGQELITDSAKLCFSHRVAVGQFHMIISNFDEEDGLGNGIIGAHEAISAETINEKAIP